MKKEEFLMLSDEEKFKYLNEQAALGKSNAEICAGIGIPKEDLAHKHGFYFVKDKFMRKPMKGYQTTQRSGNENKL